MKRVNLGIFLVLLALCAFSESYIMDIMATDGSSEKMLVSDVTKITFSGDSLVVLGTSNSLSLNSLRKIVFSTENVPVRPSPASAIGHRTSVTEIDHSFHFDFPAATSVTIYGALGQKLSTLRANDSNGGTIVWDRTLRDGRVAGTGVYFYSIQAENKTTETGRIIIK